MSFTNTFFQYNFKLTLCEFEFIQAELIKKITLFVNCKFKEFISEINELSLEKEKKEAYKHIEETFIEHFRYSDTIFKFPKYDKESEEFEVTLDRVYMMLEKVKIKMQIHLCEYYSQNNLLLINRAVYRDVLDSVYKVNKILEFFVSNSDFYVKKNPEQKDEIVSLIASFSRASNLLKEYESNLILAYQITFNNNCAITDIYHDELIETYLKMISL